MAWEITGGPYAGPWFERDSVAWVWELQRSDDDELGRVVVEVSGTAMAVTPESLPTETRDARASHGRSEVEKHLDVDDLPPLITLGTTGYITAAPFEAEERMEEGWWTQLVGDEEDLQALAEIFTEPPLRVVERNGDYYLRADAFRSLADPGDVRARAAELLRRANGAVRLSRSQSTSVELSHAVFVSEAGGRQHFEVLTVEQTAVASLGMEVIRSPGQREEISVPQEDEPDDPEQADVQSWMTLASEDPNVAQALRLLGQGDVTCSGLYHLYEIVLGDAGGRIYDEGWVTRSEIERFRRTANSPAVLGENARHGHETTEPPSNPMSQGDAQQLIEGLLVRWLTRALRAAIPARPSPNSRFWDTFGTHLPIGAPPSGWNIPISGAFSWARQDSNLGPTDYE